MRHQINMDLELSEEQFDRVLELLEAEVGNKEKEESEDSFIVPFKISELVNGLIALPFNECKQQLCYDTLTNVWWVVGCAEEEYLSRCKAVKVKEEDLKVGHFYFVSHSENTSSEKRYYRLYLGEEEGEHKWAHVCDAYAGIYLAVSNFKRYYYEVRPLKVNKRNI